MSMSLIMYESNFEAWVVHSLGVAGERVFEVLLGL